MPEWGNPAVGDDRHGCKAERTRGTETSQYLQEEKSTEMAGVAASETVRAQTGLLVGPGL